MTIDRNCLDIWLDLIKYLLDICVKNNWTIFAYDKLLLAAVDDHCFNSFIDSVDFVMRRDDFEQLSDYLNEEINHKSSKYIYEYSKYPEFYDACKFCGKLIMKETTCVYDNCNPKSYNGICVYIHPLDILTNDKKCIYSAISDAYNKRLAFISYRLTFMSADQRLASGSDDIDFEIKSAELFNKALCSATQYNSSTDLTTYIIHNLSRKNLARNLVLDMVDFASVEYVDFEGVNLPVPVGYNNILSKIFSNHMNLSLESSRIRFISADLSYPDWFESNSPVLENKLPIDIELPEGFLNPTIHKSGEVITTFKRQIDAVLLDLGNVFKNICEKYGLRYWISGGAMLGAVRDGDIIPWDDDIDFDMIREDYEKFMAVAPVELEGTRYKFELSRDGLHARILNAETTMLYRSYNNDGINGITLDIFPLDIVPKNYSDRFEIYVNVKMWKKDLQETLSRYDLSDGYYCSISVYSPSNEHIRHISNYDSVTKLKLGFIEFDCQGDVELACEEVYGSNWREYIKGESIHHTLDIHPTMKFSDYKLLMPNFNTIACRIC